MQRMALVVALAGLSVPAFATEGIAMWGCAPEGQRRSVLYLADRGSRSYVKLGDQRVAAQITMTGDERAWTFGHTSVVLQADGSADYIEGGAVKSHFTCKLMN